MNEERISKELKKKKLRASGFIHIGEIIPGVMRDIEKRIKESHEDKKVSLGTGVEEAKR